MTAEPTSFWDQRFALEGFAYGTEPNRFLVEQLGRLEPGRLLLPGEGEGRNAVWAASYGWQVTAVDASTVGRSKALALAAEHGVELDYRLQDLCENLEDDLRSFDVIALVFVHLPDARRRGFHAELGRRLRPGGTLVLEGFAKDQLGRTSGGPKDLDLLFAPDDLRTDFAGLDITELGQHEVELAEGRYHNGQAAVIRVVARRP
jgi:SAM-dependent methyltransferase